MRRIGVAVAAIAVVLGATTAVTQPASAAVVDTNASYVLVNRHSGKALDVYELATGDGAPIVQWPRNDGAWQQWQFVDSGGGYYRLKSRHSGKVLDVEGRSTADGANVVQWSDTNGTNQQFRLQDSADGDVRLINRNSGKALEVWEWSTADGARISQYTDLDGANQRWQLVRVGDNPGPGPNGRQVENLDRGLTSVRSGSGNLVSWRLLAGDPQNVGFNVYRGGTKVNSSPVTASTNYLDNGAAADASYTVRAVVNGAEQPASAASLSFGSGYRDVPIQSPG
ncbi:RICIN domain-containing protein, partial [Actinosynnema sp. NPDC059797]